MTIQPILKSVTVNKTPQRAFELFTQHMGKWWPRGVGERPHVAVVMEPSPGGRWFERDAEGAETQWGSVLEWEPPTRILLSWQLNSAWKFDPGLSTELEIIFERTDGGTKVTLEHRQLERYGADAARHSDTLRGGWPTIIDKFALFADSDGGVSDND